MSNADQISPGDYYVNRANSWIVLRVSDVSNGWVRYRYVEGDPQGLHMSRTVEDFLAKYRKVERNV